MTTITPFVDTDVTTDVSGTFGSQQTNTGGRGMYEAAQDARQQVLQSLHSRHVLQSALQ